MWRPEVMNLRRASKSYLLSVDAPRDTPLSSAPLTLELRWLFDNDDNQQYFGSFHLFIFLTNEDENGGPFMLSFICFYSYFLIVYLIFSYFLIFFYVLFVFFFYPLFFYVIIFLLASFCFLFQESDSFYIFGKLFPFLITVVSFHFIFRYHLFLLLA